MVFKAFSYFLVTEYFVNSLKAIIISKKKNTQVIKITTGLVVYLSM